MNNKIISNIIIDRRDIKFQYLIIIIKYTEYVNYTYLFYIIKKWIDVLFEYNFIIIFIIFILIFIIIFPIYFYIFFLILYFLFIFIFLF